MTTGITGVTTQVYALSEVDINEDSVGEEEPDLKMDVKDKVIAQNVETEEELVVRNIYKEK